jgi:hypothetical protein
VKLTALPVSVRLVIQGTRVRIISMTVKVWTVMMVCVWMGLVASHVIATLDSLETPVMKVIIVIKKPAQGMGSVRIHPEASHVIATPDSLEAPVMKLITVIK